MSNIRDRVLVKLLGLYEGKGATLSDVEDTLKKKRINESIQPPLKIHHFLNGIFKTAMTPDDHRRFSSVIHQTVKQHHLDHKALDQHLPETPESNEELGKKFHHLYTQHEEAMNDMLTGNGEHEPDDHPMWPEILHDGVKDLRHAVTKEAHRTLGIHPSVSKAYFKHHDQYRNID